MPCEPEIIEVGGALDIFQTASGGGAAPAQPDDALLLLERILCIPCGMDECRADEPCEVDECRPEDRCGCGRRDAAAMHSRAHRARACRHSLAHRWRARRHAPHATSASQPLAGSPLPATGGRLTLDVYRTNTPSEKQPVPVVFAAYYGLPGSLHELFRGRWAPAGATNYDGALVDYILPATGYLEVWAAYRPTDIPATYTAAEINAGVTWCLHAKWLRCCDGNPQAATYGRDVRKVYSMADNRSP